MGNKLVQLLLLALVAGLALFARPGEHLQIYAFHGQGCPHCRAEQAFLETCLKRYPALRLRTFEVYFNESDMKLFGKVAESLGAGVGGIPFLVIGDEAVIGFDRTLTPDLIERRIRECLDGSCPDRTGRLIALHEHSADTGTERPPAAEGAPQGKAAPIRVPLLGEIDPHSFPLPALTVVMGLLDGFNPCAMWALLFLITLLLGLESRTRMWILGTAFIAASALVYFLFMAAWLNLILFFGFVFWVRIGIGLLAVGSGAWSIREAWGREELSCSLSRSESRRRIHARLRTAIARNSLLLSLCGIVALAFLVNLIEIVCSAGFPAVYTQVLSLSALPAWKYYAWILLYIVFFMLDDMAVFAAAMLTLEVTGLTTKYARTARLVGGVLMFGIGVLLILRPEWLMFG